tara:strand:- start:1512 stop:2156 length:645 start_codon:yes stop_codon:yes gene_type:complete
MGIFFFPCNFVYWRKLEKHKIYKNIITNFVDKNIQRFTDHKVLSNGLTTILSRELNDQFRLDNKELFNDVAWNTLDDVLTILNTQENTLKLPITESIIQSLWISVYDTNATVSLHEHISNDVLIQDDVKYKTSFTLVYVVKDQNEKNTTVFTEPYMLAKSMYGMRETDWDTSLVDDIGEGTVMIFPSSLHHRVDLMKKPGRIIMSVSIGSNNLI